MPASPVVCRCTRFRWKRAVRLSGSLSKTVSGYREVLLAIDAVIGKAKVLGAFEAPRSVSGRFPGLSVSPVTGMVTGDDLGRYPCHPPMRHDAACVVAHKIGKMDRAPPRTRARSHAADAPSGAAGADAACATEEGSCRRRDDAAGGCGGRRRGARDGEGGSRRDGRDEEGCCRRDDTPGGRGGRRRGTRRRELPPM
jgi:hypothetical protein